MMRILLCGEGSHDIGDAEAWNSATRQFEVLEGWLQPLTRKVLRACSFDVRRRQELVFFPRDERKFRPLPEGHGAKALIAKVIAYSEGFDAVVFMADADSAKKKDWKSKRTEILAGFERIPSNVEGVACVPKSASESWLLADSLAWSGAGLADVSELPNRPEDIWGAKADPTSDRPHHYFSRICEKAGRADNRAIRFEIAVASRAGELKEKCPVSITQFFDDLEQLLLEN